MAPVQNHRDRLRGEPDLFAKGVLVGGTLFNAHTFSLEPPAVITYEQMDQVVERLAQVLVGVRELNRQGELAAH